MADTARIQFMLNVRNSELVRIDDEIGVEGIVDEDILVPAKSEREIGISGSPDRMAVVVMVANGTVSVAPKSPDGKRLKDRHVVAKGSPILWSNLSRVPGPFAYRFGSLLVENSSENDAVLRVCIVNQSDIDWSKIEAMASDVTAINDKFDPEVEKECRDQTSE